LLVDRRTGRERLQSLAKLKAVGSGYHRGRSGNLGQQRDLKMLRKDGLEGEFRSGPSVPRLLSADHSSFRDADFRSRSTVLKQR
jgi:hypothetical protein